MKNKIIWIAMLTLFSCHPVSIEEARKSYWIENGGKYICDVICFYKTKKEPFYVDDNGLVYHFGKYIGRIIKVNKDEMIIETKEKEEACFFRHVDNEIFKKKD